MTEPSLSELQRWLQGVITHPRGVAAGIDSPAAQDAIAISAADVAGVVPPSRACTSLERLGVYANAYHARLLECMRDFFPALRQALGDELFDRFSFGYLQWHPPRSYTLDRLADRFVEYLAQSRPTVERSTPGGADNHDDHFDDEAFAQLADFVVDLARLEWNIAQVFDGPGWEDAPPLSPEAFRSIPAELWPEVRLVPVACLRLLAFRFPVNDYFTAFRSGAADSIPRPQATWLALTRRDFVVRRLPLSAVQYELLSSLAAGSTVGRSIEQAAEHCGDLDHFAAELHAWFRDWTAVGLFQRLELPGSQQAEPKQLY
jgi:hypothetical protein